MRRALDRLSRENFDLLIIGGGATGCFTARDAALRGLKVALIEARDFASATSAHNSKLAHGGLRYLRNLEFSLVRESLRERRNLQAIAPHLVRPLPFLLPLEKKSIADRMALAAGLTLYDLLSYDRNRLSDPAQKMPGRRWLSQKEAAAREPVLDGFHGAYEYHDAQMYAPERIALECLVDADAHGAAIANHLAADKLVMRGKAVEGASVRDAFSGATFDIRAKLTLVAAGPWADLFLEHATGRPAHHKLLRSKGIHLLLPQFTRSALTMEAGGGHFFVLPWRGHTLLGTTDTQFQGDPGNLAVSESDIGDFLDLVNRFLPAAHLAREKVEFFYAGLRPLVDDGSGQTYNASRRSELVDHARDDGVDGLMSALGGKWTTSRQLAETITDAAVNKLELAAKPCSTAVIPLPGGRFDEWSRLLEDHEKRWPGLNGIRHLTHMFGARLPQLLEDARVADLASLGESGDTLAQIGFAVREEMALTLEDAVMRRTCLGQFGPLPNLAMIADAMAVLLGWDEARKAREIESLAPLYQTREAA
ncbi:MAG TPA: glycerol-3-phosphate dehydrogenase/oxidase [Rhizomicrobium sp.]|nr:glycerol-3-phosphate dehydrogenase/oxidase [Rhizomicrobium sp.]